MTQETFSVRSHHGSKSTVERAAEAIFTACGFFAVLAVASITLYMIFSGTPALFKVGILDILFGTLWQPAAATPSFGILYVILTSIVGTFLAILIGVPVGVMTAVFLAEVAPKKLANVVRPAVELLAGIPSVIYGLLGILILNPLMYKMELAVFKGSSTHQYTGGANLISAVLVLALMILRKKFVVQYLFSFVVGFVFGELLDVHELWINVLPTAIGWRIFYFIASYILICIGIAISNRCKMPIVPTDLFPRELSQITSVAYPKIKISFDVICLIVTAALTGFGLGHIKGLGIGTVVAAFTMGKGVGIAGNWLDKHMDFTSFLAK